MKSEILQLLEQKISQSVKLVDDKTAAEIQNVWNAINPSPNCPAVGDVMKQINKICHHGLVERGDKALGATVSTLRGFQKSLDEKLSSEVIKILEKVFPEDQYVTLAKNTKGVYERRQAPPHKFSESSYDLEMALISVGSVNLSRRAIENIRTSVDGLKLQRAAALPTKWERVKKYSSKVAGWILAILAMIIGAVILHYYLGIG